MKFSQLPRTSPLEPTTRRRGCRINRSRWTSITINQRLSIDDLRQMIVDQRFLLWSLNPGLLRIHGPSLRSVHLNKNLLLLFFFTMNWLLLGSTNTGTFGINVCRWTSLDGDLSESLLVTTIWDGLWWGVLGRSSEC